MLLRTYMSRQSNIQKLNDSHHRYVAASRPTMYLSVLMGGYFGVFPQFGKQDISSVKLGLQKNAID